MNLKTFFYLNILFLASLVIVGCGERQYEKTVDVMQYPTMQRGVEAERLGEYDEAIKMYEKTIEKHPRAAIANLQLALLLHEHKRDYIGAIYNYKVFIDRHEKEDASRLGVISNRIAIAEQLLASKFVGASTVEDASASARVMGDLNKLNQRLARVEQEKQTLVETNSLLIAEIQTLNAKITRQALWIQRLQEIPEGTSVSSPSKPGVVTSKSIRGADGKDVVVQTYEVRSGDSLSSIANDIYGDGKLWPRIRDANQDTLQGGDRVRAGDVLIIP